MHTPILKHLFISLAIILPTGINLISASLVSRSGSFVVVVKLLLLLVIIVSGLGLVDANKLSPARWEAPLSIFVAGMIIFVAYEGFELIANASEDIKNPRENLPRAFFVSVGLVIVLCILIAVITVSNVPHEKLLRAKDYALAVAAKPALGQAGFTIVTIAALLATFSAINATIYGNAQFSYMLAKDGELPERLDEKSRNIPYMGVMITTVLSLILANSIDLTEIAIIGSAGFLLVFTMVNLSAYTLAKEIGASRLTTAVSTLVSFVSFVTLLEHTFRSHPLALIVLILFILSSLLFEYLYGTLLRGHFLQRPYGEKALILCLGDDNNRAVRLMFIFQPMAQCFFEVVEQSVW